MVWSIRFKKQFKTDLKKIRHNKNARSLLEEMIDNHLLKTGTIPKEFLPHPLVGNWKPHWECHLLPDLLLIWEVDRETKEIILARIGSHSDLFG